MQPTTDIVIIGGGVIGCAIPYHLWCEHEQPPTRYRPALPTEPGNGYHNSTGSNARLQSPRHCGTRVGGAVERVAAHQATCRSAARANPGLAPTCGTSAFHYF